MKAPWIGVRNLFQRTQVIVAARLRRLVGRLIIACIALLSLAVTSVVATEGRSVSDHLDLLVLHSYHHGLPWTDAVQQGLQQGLGDRSSGIDLYIEYLV